MPLISDIRNALSYLCRGEFSEFMFRLRVHFRKIDLRYASLDELGLSRERSFHYAHSGGVQLEKVLNRLDISADDAIIDFGSGKGGALITFSKYPFSRITGVELMPELVAIAEENLKKLNITNVSLVVSDASEFTDLGAFTFFYFYSPFPRIVMEAVLHNIRRSLQARPRTAYLIYCNPEFHDSIIAGSLFRKQHEYFHRQLQHPVYVYTNTP
jgi:hypothetical protein